MSRPLAIAYLTSQYPARSHTFIRREVAALRAKGLAIRTYSIRPGDRDGGTADDATFTVLAQPAIAFAAAHAAALLTRPGCYLSTLMLALRHRPPGARALLWSALHFAEAVLLARRLRADRVEAIHNHFANSAATVGLLAAHFLRLPWSLTLHGISEFDYPAGLLLADKIARARFVAGASRFVMAQAMRLIEPAHWPKLHLVRCGIDPAALPPTGSPTRRDVRIVCVGRLSPEKGQAGLISAVASLVRRRPGLEVTIVGDGPERERLHAQVAAAGLGEVVRFTGALDEAATLRAIAAADLMVLPSLMEGLPVVLMEALALGVPAVATRVAGIPELVRDGETGLLFDPADWEQMAEAIDDLAGDPARRARLGEAGRAVVAEQFAIDRAVAPLPGLFAQGLRP